MSEKRKKTLQMRLERENESYRRNISNVVRDLVPQKAEHGSISANQRELQELQREMEKLRSENAKHQEKNPRGAGRKPKFDGHKTEEIHAMRESGMTIPEIAKACSCSVGLIHKLVHNKASKPQKTE